MPWGGVEICSMSPRRTSTLTFSPQERLSDELLEEARYTDTEFCPSALTINPSTCGRRSPSPEQSIGPRFGTPEASSKGTNLSGCREIAGASTKRGSLGGRY